MSTNLVTKAKAIALGLGDETSIVDLGTRFEHKPNALDILSLSNCSLVAV